MLVEGAQPEANKHADATVRAPHANVNSTTDKSSSKLEPLRIWEAHAISESSLGSGIATAEAFAILHEFRDIVVTTSINRIAEGLNICEPSLRRYKYVAQS